MPHSTRRAFLRSTTPALAGTALGAQFLPALAQLAGERPQRATDIKVLNPRNRVPVGMIIDDSTCLVNLNRFAMPQFDTAFGGSNPIYQRNWRDWPLEIPDSFVRKFGEWCASRGVKGKYSIVPYPACVGRIDRMLPGWSERELRASIELVRSVMMPNWDIHPEMVTHTRVIDLKTGHPHVDHSVKFMENWEWTTGRSADEIGDYMAYALNILKNAGLECEGVTTPGGFGVRARPQLSVAALRAVREVFGAEIPHYFRDLYDRGTESVAPRVENASGLDSANPQCVVSIVACTGDWTGGWDNTPPEGVDKFITEDLKSGRMVEVIERGEPALMLAHWTGIYWNGEERGFKVFQEVVRRLHARFDNLIWMKLRELARYWAAKELTRIEQNGNVTTFTAPYACPDFTVRLPGKAGRLELGDTPAVPLSEVSGSKQLKAGSWTREGDSVVACFDLRKGRNALRWS